MSTGVSSFLTSQTRNITRDGFLCLFSNFKQGIIFFETPKKMKFYESVIYCNPMVEPCHGLTFLLWWYHFVTPAMCFLDENQQSVFVDVITWHYSKNSDWVDNQLKHFDTVNDDLTIRNTVAIGNLAYIGLHAPLERQRIKVASTRNTLMQYCQSKMIIDDSLSSGFVYTKRLVLNIFEFFFYWLFKIHFYIGGMDDSMPRDLLFLRQFEEMSNGHCNMTSSYTFYPYQY